MTPEKKFNDGWDDPGWKTASEEYHKQRSRPAVHIADNHALDENVQRHDSQALIDQLAKASELVYQQSRKAAAKELGIGEGALEKLVKRRRTEFRQNAEPPPLYPHWVTDLLSRPVDGRELVAGLIARIRQHVAMHEHQAVAVALWVILSWVHEQAAVHSPILLVTSAEANSGKSTLLGIVQYMAQRSLASASISGPALFRSLEKWHPTFVIDEADTAFVHNEDLRQVINSGWTRGQNAIRCDPDTNDPRPYSTFAPKALGMKGRKLPETTLSRCIIIELQRKKPNEAAQDFDHIDDGGFVMLRRRLSRWADDNAAALAKATPAIPPGFRNRNQANWKLLFAIADACGVGGAAREAAEKLSGTLDVVSVGVELLAACKAVFDAHQLFERSGAAVMPSRALVERLTADPESRWHEWGKAGKPLTQKQLGSLLGQYHIESETIHPADAPDARGYKRARFEDAWERFEVSKCPNADEMALSTDFRSVLAAPKDTSKNPNLSYSHAGLDTWTLRKSENSAKREFDHAPAPFDADDGYPELPAILRREPVALKPDRTPPLGPPGDSLDDLDPSWGRR